MHDNSVIMPLLFLTFGMFLFPNVEKRGFGGYFKNRFYRLVVPYLIGIPLIVPLLAYPRYHYLTNPLMGYWEFFTDVYFQEKMQGGGPFWVLYCLLLFSLVALCLNKIIPGVRCVLAHLLKKAVAKPIVGSLVFVFLSMVILGVSDILWGAPWWIGFGHLDVGENTFLLICDKILNLFHLQGSRFILNALFFAVGIALTHGGLTQDAQFWEKLSRNWRLWLFLMLVCGCAYIGFSLTYFEAGAYNDDPHRLVDMGGTWEEAWPLLKLSAPMTLTRTSLHGVFVFFQVLTYVSIAHRFAQKSNRFWTLYTPCAYGIFLLHEVPVIWLQSMLADVHLPTVVKILICGGIGLSTTWVVVVFLRRSTLVRKVLG